MTIYYVVCIFLGLFRKLPVLIGMRTYFPLDTHFRWDVRSGKCVMNVATKGENINIDWSPDGKTIAVGNKEDLGLLN